jgi:plasmid stabilization system protein ParE
MNIFWTDEAVSTFEQNIQYLEKEWNEKVIQKFFDKTEHALNRIAQNPATFPLFNQQKGIHKCLIVKQITLYYKIDDDKIYLLSFWNNYQDPEKLNI